MAIIWLVEARTPGSHNRCALSPKSDANEIQIKPAGGVQAEAHDVKMRLKHPKVVYLMTKNEQTWPQKDGPKRGNS